jgi:hypothetical protein
MSHGEEPCDEAISQRLRLPRRLRASQRLRRIAALPSVARNDNQINHLYLYRQFWGDIRMHPHFLGEAGKL